MENLLWNKILAFDFDQPISDYGFSVRLAKENFWTINFTAEAILEYKKFMYLAATAKQMVSPSEIVDTVWHQHLIFTQSYNEFCTLLGKRIEHVPSTHNRDEFEKFKLAKERTQQLYSEVFGEQPKEIWNFATIHEPLNLEKSKFKIRSFLIVGILLVLFLMFPVTKLLNPVYLQIKNPLFLIGFILFIVIVFLGLESYSRSQFSKLVNGWNKNLFIFNLSPFELIYMKKRNFSDVIHANVNNLITAKNVKISSDNKLFAGNNDGIENQMQFITYDTLESAGRMPYALLYKILAAKPIFTNIPNAIDAFLKYFIKSKFFARLFVSNFVILSLVFLFGIGRLFTGISRGKPVGLLTFILIIYFFLTVFYFFRLVVILVKITLPEYYKTNIIPTKENRHKWDWSAYLIGNSVLATAFLPLIYQSDISSSNSGGSGGCSSGGNSCSNGSSCGGCGGGD